MVPTAPRGSRWVAGQLSVGLRMGQLLETAGKSVRLLLVLEDLPGPRLRLAGHHLRRLPPRHALRVREIAATQRTVAGASQTTGTVDACQATNLV
jgi:hypothetical protein